MQIKVRDYILKFILSISVVLGFIIRIKGIDKWPLAVDEYYTVKSIQHILEYGIPIWPNGGLNIRGILYKYIVAGIALIFGMEGFNYEYASRMVLVFFNFLCLPPLYLIAKKIKGELAAVIVVFIFCFSVWEIETVRFARMYIPFQTIFIWYLYFLYKLIIEKDIKAQKWLYILSVVSVFVHEGAIFIILLNFFPFFWNKKIKPVEFAVSSLIFAVSFYYLTFNFWNYGLTDLLPNDVVYPYKYDTAAIRIPVVLLEYILPDVKWILLLLIPFSLSLILLKRIIKTDDDIYSKISFIVIIISALLNQFGILFIFLLVALLSGWLKIRQVNNKTIALFVSVVISFLLYWIVFCFYNNILMEVAEIDSPSGGFSMLKKILVFLFNYPNIYYLTRLYYSTIPLLTISFIVLIGAGITGALIKDNESNKGVKILTSVLLLEWLIFSLVITEYFDTRYSFHIYPLILLSGITSFFLIIEEFKIKYKETAVILITILILFLSEDFNIYHFINVDSKEINFRTVYKYPLKRHYRIRHDVKTPAEVVNREYKNGDIVIIEQHNMDFYLKHLDYIYVYYMGGKFGSVSLFEGKKERWTNKNLIYRTEDLLELIGKFNDKHGSTLWFMTEKDNPSLKEISFFKEFENKLYSTGIDSTVYLYKFN